MKFNTLEEFTDYFYGTIEPMGYVRSVRKGDCGVGMTLESLFKIPENNSKLSDFLFAELKTFCNNSTSLLTLLTCDLRAWKIRARNVVETYGYLSEETNLPCLRTTVSPNPNNRGFYHTFDDEILQVKHEKNETEILCWKWDLLNPRFYNKLKSLIYVEADVKVDEDGREHFYYPTFHTFHTENKTALLDYFKSSDPMYVDIRCSLKYNKKGRIYLKNHGTAFRVPPSKLIKVFSTT